MIFVLAAALATVVVLLVTLSNLLPLNRTQIFFLTAHPRENTDIQLTSFSPNDSNIDLYKENFIREYIRMRNEIIPNADIMHNRWCNRRDCAVHLWSTQGVFDRFMQTRMWRLLMETNAGAPFPARCRVEFRSIDPYRPADRNDEGLSSEHLVRFRYFCSNTDNARQTDQKDYTIVIGIKFQQSVRWSDRLENPLGMVVFQYRTESGEPDPLDQFLDSMLRGG